MPATPDEAVGFINNLRHVKGRFAGTPFNLRDWQEHEIIRPIFRQRPDGHRIVRKGLVGTAKKNGKSEVGAALALTCLTVDNEPGGDVVIAATKRDQAKLIGDVAIRMATTSVIAGMALREHLRIYRNAIYYPELDATLKVISSDASSEEGLNPRTVIVDEVHAHRDPSLWHALEQAQGAWEDPLFLGFTTAGEAPRPGDLCYELYKYGKQIEAGVVSDPSFYFKWWEADSTLDWHDPEAWKQANPALGDFKSFEYVERMAREADRLGKEYVFRRYQLNQWTSATEKSIPTTVWDECNEQPEFSDGVEIVIALDAAISRDTFAIGWGCVGDKRQVNLKVKVFTPPLGSRYIDGSEVKTFLYGLLGQYAVREIAYDPAFLHWFITELADVGAPVEPFPQSPEKMAKAWSTFEGVVHDKLLRHGGDITLGSHLANVALIPVGDRGARRPSKSKSGGPIDGIIASVMVVERLTSETGDRPFAFVVGQSEKEEEEEKAA